MREVLIADTVLDKISELRSYLLEELKLSREAALKRTDRMDEFLRSLGNAADYPLCRFRKWCSLGIIVRSLKRIGFLPMNYSRMA